MKALIEAAIIVAFYCISGNQTCIECTSTLWILLMHIRLAYQPSLPETLRIVLQSTEERYHFLSNIGRYQPFTEKTRTANATKAYLFRSIVRSTPLSVYFVLPSIGEVQARAYLFDAEQACLYFPVGRDGFRRAKTPIKKKCLCLLILDSHKQKMVVAPAVSTWQYDRDSAGRQVILTDVLRSSRNFTETNWPLVWTAAG